MAHLLQHFLTLYAIVLIDRPSDIELGHFHAAAHLTDEYRSLSIRMIMEELVYVDGLGFREIDIRATIGGVPHMDIEVKTYLGQLGPVDV